MSYAFAGALAGGGAEIAKIAEDKRKHAIRLKEIEAEGEARAKNKRGRSGTGLGGAVSGGLNNTQSDNLARLYKDYVENGAFEGQPPSLAEFESQVERVIGDEGSLAKAAERARGEWKWSEVEVEREEERGFVGRLWHGEDTRKVTDTELRGGFNGALGGNQPPAAAAAKPAPTAPGPDADHAIEEAKAAIKKGAPREMVIARLQEMGIDPKGL